MSILISELIMYGSANHQETDSGTQGGAITTSVKLELTDISATGTVEVLSNNAGDTTQTITVTGRDAAGVIVSQILTLNGTTPVASTQNYERILKAVKNATTAGTITLRKASDDVTIGVFDKTPVEIFTIRRLFYDASAPPSGTRDYYEKAFLKNTNGTLTLTAATVIEQADPTAKVTFAVGTALDDTGTSTNRLTAPASGVTAFDSTTKNVANSQNLTAGAAQSVWLRLTLTAGDAATKNTYTPRLSGTST